VLQPPHHRPGGPEEGPPGRIRGRASPAPDPSHTQAEGSTWRTARPGWARASATARASYRQEAHPSRWAPRGVVHQVPGQTAAQFPVLGLRHPGSPCLGPRCSRRFCPRQVVPEHRLLRPHPLPRRPLGVGDHSMPGARLRRLRGSTAVPNLRWGHPSGFSAPSGAHSTAGVPPHKARGQGVPPLRARPRLAILEGNCPKAPLRRPREADKAVRMPVAPGRPKVLQTERASAPAAEALFSRG